MARIKPQALLIQSKKKKGPTRISTTTIILCNIVVVLIVLSLVATYRHWSQRSRDQTGLSNFEESFQKLKASQSTEEANGEEVQSCTKDDDDLFVEATGGTKKARLYGLGNLAISHIFKGSGSTSQQVNENMLTEIRDEINNKVSHIESKLETKIADMTRFLVENQTWIQNMLLGRPTEPPRWAPTEPTPPAEDQVTAEHPDDD